MKAKKPSQQEFTQSLDEFVEERDAAKFSENQDLLRGKRAATSEARREKERADGYERELGLYRVLDAAHLSPPEWLAPSGPSKGHRAIPSLVVGDVHWGEVVDPAQVEGLNKYNVAIAARRVRRAFEGAVVLCRDYLKGVTYEGVTLFLPGDLVNGDIQLGRESNEQTIAESVMGVVEPLEAGINLLAKEFGKVHVAGVPGNHARNSLKPLAKNRARDNFDTLAYRVMERDYRSDKRVTVQVSDSADAPVAIYGTKYVLTHGDQFHGGSGISGALAPLLLGAHRKTRRAATAGRPYDSLVMGHWHQALHYPSKGIIVSGCVVGYDEYAYVSNFEPEPPQCALWLTTPERGITVSAPVMVGDREAEGW